MKTIAICLVLAAAITTSCGTAQSSEPDEKEEIKKEASWKGHEEKQIGDFEVWFSENRAAIFRYLGNSKEVEIPAQIEGMPVTRICDIAFRDNLELEKVVVPEGITRIGEVAFGNCENLKEVSMPASLMEIKRGAFWGCSSLENVNISKKNPYLILKDQALYSKDLKTLYFILPEEGRTHFEIHDGVEVIGDSAFWDGEELVGITVSQSIIEIEDDAFAYCESLEEISIPKSVAHIGVGAFKKCYRLKKFDLSGDNPAYMLENGVLFNKDRTLLHTYLYRNTENSYTVPESVKQIEASAFSDCSMLKSIILPQGLEEIGEGAFAGCSLLKSISIPPRITDIKDDAFSNCRSLTSVDLPDSVRSIGNMAFFSCGSLEYVSVPDSVVSIGRNAFYDYGESLTLEAGTNSEALRYANENKIKVKIR